jgi:hypothetical protein
MASQSVSCHDLYPEAKHSVFCPPVMQVLSTRPDGCLQKNTPLRNIHSILWATMRNSDACQDCCDQQPRPLQRPGRAGPPAGSAPASSKSLGMCPNRSKPAGSNPACGQPQSAEKPRSHPKPPSITQQPPTASPHPLAKAAKSQGFGKRGM